jgi:CRP-like cAMP-binding protein
VVARSTVAVPPPPANKLLAALPRAEFEHLKPYLELAPLAIKTVLYKPDHSLSHVYFPTTAVLSLLTVLKDGSSIEVGLVGREGMAGLAAFLGAPTPRVRCMVQVPGEAYRMRAQNFRDQVSRNSALHGLLLGYTHRFMTQLSQLIACNSQHAVEQRLCRWLLMTHLRVGVDRFPVTHEFLAAMLGVRRASVSEVAQRLQEAGLIRYHRGAMTILDHQGLEASACECYQAVRSEVHHTL